MEKFKRDSFRRGGFLLALAAVLFLLGEMPVQAQNGQQTQNWLLAQNGQQAQNGVQTPPGQKIQADQKIKPGIFAGHIDLSGMTQAQANETVQGYIDGLKGVEISLRYATDAEVKVTAGELGLAWANAEIVAEAAGIGTKGNVIERYKMLKDLERTKKVYPIEISFDIRKISDILTNKCASFDQKAQDYGLVRENNSFRIVEGKRGRSLDVETSIDLVNDYLTREWDKGPCTIALDVWVEEPRGSMEELAQVKDILGSFSTSYRSSGTARSANVENGCRLVNGQLLYPGDEFSMYTSVAPFSADNGYYMAGSYINGKVVDSLGGGICQVSTTLYNAVLLAELDISERHNHSMVVGYVPRSADAAIAESSGKDFRFVNSLEYPVYIEGYVNEKKQLIFNIYGKEVRSPGRKVRYESEELEVNVPTQDEIHVDATKPVGYIVSEGAHIGYKARLWKIVTENGKEISRTPVNSSTYKMAPRTATVGTATDNPTVYGQIMAAVQSGSIDQVKAVIAALTAQAASNSVEVGDL